MSKQRFSTGAKLRWQGATYQITRLLPGGQILLEDILTGAALTIELATLVHALFAAELCFVTDNNQPEPTADQAPNQTAVASRSLSDYPEPLVAIARYRLEVIRPLLVMPQRSRAEVLARAQEIKDARPVDAAHTLLSAVSVAAIYRWLSDYLGSGNDLRSLIPAVHERGGKDDSRLRTETQTITANVIQDKHKAQGKFTIDDVRHELAVRLDEENRVRPPHDQLAPPSRATLARRIAASNTSQEQRKSGNSRTATGADIQYVQTPYPDWPLERVEIDHTRTDLIVIDDRDNLPLGRLTLTYCLDTATRYPLGYYLGFEPPSYLPVMECLCHAIRPKGDVRQQYGTEHEWSAYGIPATLVVDNGKEFVGHDLEDACLLLGTVLQYTPVRTPQFKAGVERMFGSLNTMLFHTLPGTTFSNPGERGSYDSSEQACVYLSAVDKMLHLFLVDIYAERFHDGLGGIPARRWETKTQHGFAPALPPSAEELAILLGRTTTRVIQRYGIEFISLRFNCDDLLPLRTRLKGHAAKIKYHPADLSCLYVYDPFEQQYIRVPALDQEYTRGLSLWKHRVIRQAVLAEQDRVDIVALGQAKRKIQAIVDAGRQRKGQQTRTRIARWDTAGKPTRQVVKEPADKMDNPHVATADESTLPNPTPITLTTTVLATQEAGWEVSYAPIRHANALVALEEKEVSHG
jgi:putative transposase